MPHVLLLIWDQIQDFQTLYLEKYQHPSTPTIYWKISKETAKNEKKIHKQFSFEFSTVKL